MTSGAAAKPLAAAPSPAEIEYSELALIEAERQSDDQEELFVEDAPVADDEAPAEQAAPRRRWTGRVMAGLAKPVVSLVLVAALLVVSVLLVLSRMSVSHQSALNGARASALAAAKADSVELASYDYHHLDQDFGKVLADSTPAFKQSFSQSSGALKTILARYNATAQANVVAAGLVSASTGRAVALVFLNQTVTNTTQKKGQPSTTQSRVEITLLHQHGRWLIDQVSLL